MDAEEQSPEVPEQAEERDPLARMSDLLSELDRTALVVGFATVVEWLEADGSRSLSLLGTEMDPWHAYGLLTYGRQQLQGGGPIEVFEFDGEGEEDDF
jgi:hypothetical protein